MSATAAAPFLGRPVTDRPLIRPPDPAIRGTTHQYMPERQVPSHNAVRRLLHLAFRDAVTVLDLTYAGGGCWRRPRPPGIVLATNDLDPSLPTDLHLNYCATGLEGGSFDVLVFDPPHTADNGQSGIFWARYRGAAKGNQGLVDDVVAGALEAWRVARVGIIVKVCDSSHGSEFVMLSYAVIAALAALGVRPYTQLTTYRPTGIPDPKRKVERVPVSNGAIYLAFRKDSHKHRDFDERYERQQASHMASLQARRRCPMCDAPIGLRRSVATTCSARCRKALSVQRRRST